MAKVTFTATGIRRYSGTSGNAVYRKRGDETILASRPERSNRPPTEAELDVRKLFRRASYYSKNVQRTPEKRALYEEVAISRGLSVYTAAMQDYLTSPVIDDFDVSEYAGKSGDIIHIVALDDRGVEKLDVVMTDGDGTLLEEGAAVKEFEGWWVYTATADVPEGTTVRIAATATDLPKNKGTGEVEMAV